MDFVTILITSLLALGAILGLALTRRKLDPIEVPEAAWERVRTQDPEFFAAVSGLIFRHDPIRINFESNTDEYDSIAGETILRLAPCSSASQLATVIHSLLVSGFGADLAGEPDDHLELAEDILNLWHEERRVTEADDED